MKTNHIIKNLAALALLATLNSQLSTAFAQGSLTPPGQPAPTMKSADQIYSKLDPRTPISSAPFIITNSGSYYLTTNLTVISGDGIDINTNGVTLDLNGFTISSTATSATGYGIGINESAGALSDFTIVNGHISGNFNYGISYPINISPKSLLNILISKVSVQGVSINGIDIGSKGSSSLQGINELVEDCTVYNVGGVGIRASTVKNSTAFGCGQSGIIGDLVSDCQGNSSGSFSGISTSSAAFNCIGSASGSGFGVNSAGIAIGCVGSCASGTGLRAAIANSCIIQAGTTNVTYHCNMPW